MAYELNREGVTYYFGHEGYNEYKIKGFSIDKRPEIVYSISGSFEVEEKSMIHLPDLISTQVSQRAERQLKTYLEANKYRYDIYDNIEETDIIYSNYHCLNTKPDNICSIYYRYDNLLDGRIDFDIANYNCNYDIHTGKIQAGFPFFYMLYKDSLKYKTAGAQLESGIAPPALMELKKIHEFVSERQQVTIVMDDDTEHTIRTSNDNLSRITRINEDHLSFSINYYTYHRFKDIKFIKYGRSAKYYPDKEKLQCLTYADGKSVLDFWKTAA